MRVVILPLLGLLVGCYDYESFQRESGVVTCEWAEECGVLDWTNETLEECIDDKYADIRTNDACVNFNPDAARACIAELEQVTCSFGNVWDAADSCEDVCD